MFFMTAFSARARKGIDFFFFRMGFELLEATAERDGGVGGQVSPFLHLL